MNERKQRPANSTFAIDGVWFRRLSVLATQSSAAEAAESSVHHINPSEADAEKTAHRKSAKRYRAF